MADELLAAHISLRDTWPATETQEVGGWQLRAIGGAYRRSNSVWPGAFSGEVPVEEAIDRAEAFYRKRNLQPRFQVLRESLPSGLDAILERRGYASEFPSTLLSRAVGNARMPSHALFGNLPTPDWLQMYTDSQSPERAGEFRYVLVRVPASRAFLLLREGEEPRALALAVRRGSDVVIDCVLTHPEHRRAGAGIQIVQAAEAWAAGQDARRLLLAVMDDNAPARALYAKAGYAPLSAYHYRTLLRG